MGEFQQEITVHTMLINDKYVLEITTDMIHRS